jgi:hypothetical protein
MNIFAPIKDEPTQRQKLSSKFDKLLESDFGKDGEERCLRCCDVIRLP